MLRRLATAALVLTAGACEPSLPQVKPGAVVNAVFDPTKSEIPLPNDLVFFAIQTSGINSVCPPPANTQTGAPACAQAELLAGFGGKFPSDQEVAVTIDFQQTTVENGKAVVGAPDLDMASLTATTFQVFGTVAGVSGPIAMDPPTAADYVKGTDRGTLHLHHKGKAPWAEGQYAVYLRGGDSGIKTKDGLSVAPSQTFYLITQGKDYTKPENIGLIRAQAGSTEAAIELGRQLNLLVANYTKPFAAIDAVFPHQELAAMTTFAVGPAYTNVTVDPARGLVPLPIDLLRDATTGKLSALAACTLAGGTEGADGSCSPASAAAAAAGFATLDGFSTTGAILGGTSDLIQAGTVTGTTLQLWELPKTGAPVQVPAASLIVEPCEFTSAAATPTPANCAAALAPVIALQPAGATAVDQTSVFRTRPLKENTDYAVVMTTGIKDKAGNAIAPGTVAKVLRFANAISVDGKSQLQGIDDATAASLEKMRLQLKPVFTALAGAGIQQKDVAMAYTFHTQAFLKTAVQLAALPYTQAAATGLPIAGSLTTLTPAAAFTKWGVDGAVPSTNIDEVLEVDINTFNLLDPATGAFNPDPAKAVAERIHVIIATPKTAPACAGALAAFGKCSPMMVFRHGLGRGRADMLLLADSMAAQGLTTVAIDAAKHGDRSFCTSGTTGAMSGCVGGAACTTTLPAGAQGDANPPGTCGTAGFVKRPLSPTATGNTDGIPAVSGNYLTSANFFRTRDTLRQDAIDEAQLVRAIAATPAAPPTGHLVFDHMVGRGLIIDPTKIYYSGQSLGAIQGAMNVATNPRISRAVFNVGGGTLTDIFVVSPAFKAQTLALLASLGITPGTAKFLQFLVVAKTVLDPADPINYVGHIQANTLPNLLPPLGGNTDGSVPQAAKSALMQIANCDQTVTNPFNYIYAANLGVSPLPATPPPVAGTFQLFTGGLTTADGCTSGIAHGFLIDYVVPGKTLSAQTDLAAFAASLTQPPSVR